MEIIILLVAFLTVAFLKLDLILFLVLHLLAVSASYFQEKPMCTLRGFKKGITLTNLLLHLCFRVL